MHLPLRPIFASRAEFYQRTHRVRLKNLGTTDKIFSQNQVQKDSESTLTKGLPQNGCIYSAAVPPFLLNLYDYFLVFL